MPELEIGEYYKYEVKEYRDAVEIRLYEDKKGKEMDLNWPIAGEVIASRIKRIKGIEESYYSPSLGYISIKIPKDVESIESVARAIVDVICKVISNYRTAKNRIESVFKESGLKGY